jgi:hypothetical protein
MILSIQTKKTSFGVFFNKKLSSEDHNLNLIEKTFNLPSLTLPPFITPTQCVRKNLAIMKPLIPSLSPLNLVAGLFNLYDQQNLFQLSNHEHETVY